MLKRFISFLTVLLAVQFVAAQAPAGYYSSTKGSSGRNLKTAMFKVIGSHKDIGYDGLWKAFRDTDCRPDGKVWDMYSNTTNFRFGTDQDKGRHSKEGDTYNREHSFPKSWFGDARPMHNDLFHLYPTDSYVNGMRSNYAFGETEHPSKTSNNGFSKFGSCTTPGYSGEVFEPNDEYKGDFARSYFYMATAYEDRFSKFSSPMLARNSYPCYTKWALDMLLRWAKEDPVSEKEIKRNNAVYKHQNNRNPYIDFPGLEEYVWGDKQNVAFDPDNYNNGGGVTPDPEPNPNPGVSVAAPVFSVASGQVAVNTEVTISSTTAGATIYYTVNNTAEVSGASPVKYTITEDASISAYAQLGDKKSETVKATYTVAKAPVFGDGVYVRVENAADLTLGHRYLIVCESENVAMAEEKKDIRGYASVTIKGNEIKTDVVREGKPYAFVLGRTANHYTFCDISDNTYLSINTNGNKLYSVKDCNGTDAQWNIEMAAGIAEIVSVKYKERSIQYNSGAPRFAAYKPGQTKVALYKETVADAIEYPEMEKGTVDVYTIGGRLLRDDVKKSDAVKGLPRGIYIIGGVKVLVK